MVLFRSTYIIVMMVRKQLIVVIIISVVIGAVDVYKTDKALLAQVSSCIGWHCRPLMVLVL